MTAVVVGEGALPLLVLQELRRLGRPSLALGIHGVSPAESVAQADKAEWVGLTQLGRTLRLCRRHGIKELVMVGRIRHRSIYQLKLWRADWATLRLLWSLKDRRTDSLLGAVARAFERCGIEVAPMQRYLKRHLAGRGQLTPNPPSSQAAADIAFGLPIARELGRLDIGQTVVIKNRAIVAVEAMEGTDACIERAAELAGPGCTVIKLAKPNQDMRFDVPVIGATTLKKLIQAQVAALAIEAERTLLLDQEWLAQAHQAGISVIALEI
jgi:UDP-2,3-diacylglucosamine hydrolase